jgi:hypothetical protein
VRAIVAVYETVKTKEAEKRRDKAAADPEKPFVDVLKEQWEARKAELAAAAAAEQQGAQKSSG